MDESTLSAHQEPPTEATGAPTPALSAASRALPKKTPPAKPANPPTPATVIDVRFLSGSKPYSFDPGHLVIPVGAHVIIDTARGPEYGICTKGNHTVPLEEVVQPLRPVIRVATLQDERNLEENQGKEEQAFAICAQKIQEHGLDMKLVRVEFAFDGSKILFFFTADGRVDFRDLVKDLAAVFRTRIELRQIGVRDEAKMLGGLGICGRPFCCAQFLDAFQPVSIKMAKTQSLSLNPTKISGSCGRLMCCLKYEQDGYEDLMRTCPRTESLVDTPAGRGTVTGVNLLREQVNVALESDPSQVKTYKNCEICVLRSGKAKKNDPPIPKDVAPISSLPQEPSPPEPDPFLLPEPILYGHYEQAPAEPQADSKSDSQPAPQPERKEHREHREPSQGRSKEHRDGAHSQRHHRHHSRPTGEAAQASHQERSERNERHDRNDRQHQERQSRNESDQAERSEVRQQRTARNKNAAQRSGSRRPNNYHRRNQSRRNSSGGGSESGE